MGIKPENVLEALCYEYAKLIADAAVETRTGLAPHSRRTGQYWSFAAMIFYKPVEGKISPSPLLRENKLLVSTKTECAYCGVLGMPHWEHLFPKSRGGPETIDNLVLACPTCNFQKGALNPVDWYWKRGMDAAAYPEACNGKMPQACVE